MVKKNVVKNIKKFSKKRIGELPDEFKLKKITCFPNSTNYRGIVIIKGIKFSAKCEHHEVAIHGIMHIGYVPGFLLPGLSQIPRIIESIVNPTVGTTQEIFTQQIADKLYKEIEPLGLIVVCEAVHECMSARGVRQRTASTITSELRGFVFWHADAKTEFFQLIKMNEGAQL